MAFAESLRSWWLRVQNGQCQYRFYDGDKIRKCSNPAKEVHHLQSESYCLENGINPNEVPGLALCEPHHRHGFGDLFEGDGSFHPDMSQAALDYRSGNKQAFKQASKKHHEAAKGGVDLWEDKWREIEFYVQGLLGMANRYLQNHPEDPKPYKLHSKIMQPKRWYDVD